MANKTGKINYLEPKIHLAYRCHFAEGATCGATRGGQIWPHQMPSGSQRGLGTKG
jgi:hypothetical protein